MAKKSTIIFIVFILFIIFISFVRCSVEQKKIVGKIDMPIETKSKNNQLLGYEKIAKNNNLIFYNDESSNGERSVSNLSFYTKNNCVISVASNYANEKILHFVFYQCDDASWNELYNDLKFTKKTTI